MPMLIAGVQHSFQLFVMKSQQEFGFPIFRSGCLGIFQIRSWLASQVQVQVGFLQLLKSGFWELHKSRWNKRHSK